MPSASLADEAVPHHENTWQDMAQLRTELLLTGHRTSISQSESKMALSVTHQVPGSLVFSKVVGQGVNGTTFTRIKAFSSVGLGHHQFACLAQATKKLVCCLWEQSRRGRHCKGFVCLELCVASSGAQGEEM